MIATNPRFQSAETGRWVEWIGKTLPAAQGDKTIRDLVSQWTTTDYQAAGSWLTTAPEGPAKTTAVRAYAETIARTDPETATQWAMTLPPGEDRETTLKSILATWPREDTAGKDAFAREHAIK